MEDHGEHNLGDHEDPLPGPTWIVGILGAVLLSIIMLGLTALFFNADAREVDLKVTEKDYPQLQTLNQQQRQEIEGPPRIVEVVENERVVQAVRIPIDDAIAKYAERAASEQRNPPPPPPPATAPATAPATTAPAASPAAAAQPNSPGPFHD